MLKKDNPTNEEELLNIRENDISASKNHKTQCGNYEILLSVRVSLEKNIVKTAT